MDNSVGLAITLIALVMFVPGLIFLTVSIPPRLLVRLVKDFARSFYGNKGQDDD